MERKNRSCFESVGRVFDHGLDSWKNTCSQLSAGVVGEEGKRTTRNNIRRCCWQAGIAFRRSYCMVRQLPVLIQVHLQLRACRASIGNMHPTHGGTISSFLILHNLYPSPRKTKTRPGKKQSSRRKMNLPELGKAFPAISSPICILVPVSVTAPTAPSRRNFGCVLRSGSS